MMESNKSLSLFLLAELIKICLVDLDHKYDGSADENTFPDVIENYRKLITETPHYCTFRWNKKLMQLCVNEMSKVGGDPEDAVVHLNVSISNFLIYHDLIRIFPFQKIHITYIISIFCIKSEILGNHLKEFLSKILILLMTVAKNYSTKRFVIKSVVEFIKSLREHVSTNEDFIKFKDTFDKVLENKMLSL